ncbi:MAG TPA: methyltransferase [Halieaceae bacterium]|nr:MAG: methyltransferase [Gammaproteobacteria bacterium]HDY83061.1 methyltransferase [Halieaceae bacterium]
MKANIPVIALALVITSLLGPSAFGADYDVVKAKLKSAMAADIRNTADTDRDRNRRPVETLEFFRLRDDMRVVELLPGGGWYTKLLAPVLAENGEFYIAYGTSSTWSRLEGKPGFKKMQVAAGAAEIGRAAGARFYTASNTDLGVKNVDMVLTFRNYHNFDEPSRGALNKSVFKALKSGGIYGVVDHTRRHMQELNNENRRRVDPVQAIVEIQAAGFELVDYSGLHYRADDELIYEVGRRTVTGNTDRWTLMFRKP